MVLCLLLGTSLPSFASYTLTNDDILYVLQDFVPLKEDDCTSGLQDYLDQLPTPYGIVNDSTGTIGYDILYYGGAGFDDWQSETSWTTGSNIQINKIFALSDLQDFLDNHTDITPQNIYYSYFQPAVGYKITFVREENSIISEGSKYIFDLVLTDVGVDACTASAGLDVPPTYTLRDSSLESLYSNTDSSNMIGYTSNDNYRNVALFNNNIEIHGLTVANEDILITSFQNVSDFNYDMTVPEDLQHIYITVEYDMLNSKANSSTFGFPYVYNLSLSGDITVDESGVVSGLLNGIINWLRNILNAILDLPQNIVNLLKTALNELFVPSPEFISGKFDEFKALAESKLGFLFTMLDMVVDLFTTLSTNIATPSETLTIPSLRLPFSYVDGGQLVLWNDMTFTIFPDGLDVLKNLCHLVTSIVLITATISYCVSYVRNFFEKE